MLIYAQIVYEQLFSQKSFHVVYINYFILAGIAGHKQYIDKHGQDMPEIRDWTWSNPA